MFKILYRRILSVIFTRFKNNYVVMKNKKLIFSFSAFFTIALLLVSCGGNNSTKSGLSKSDFQMQVAGKQNNLYVLTNKKGMEVCMTNFGARIVSVMAPDKNGKFGDVVLGFDSIGGYLNNQSDFGAFIGRYANRIKHGQITLGDSTYKLSINNFGHTLHGGVKGYQYRMFDIKQNSDNQLTASLIDPDGFMGFPGTVYAKATYTLTDDNSIDIKYEATATKPTVINFTNHSYFNLTGNPGNKILDNVLMINADSITPVDSTFMTTGETIAVEGTPMDFRSPMSLGNKINDYGYLQLKNGNGYDHNYVLNTKGDISKIACRLEDPASGRTLEVYTTEPGVQLYTGNFLDGTLVGKKGIAYQQRVGVCLETQHYPDSPNKPFWPSVVLNPGEKYESHTILHFGIKK